MEITEKRLRELEDMEAMLNALERGGVDNWEHYGDSLEEYSNNKEKQDGLYNLLEDIEVILLNNCDEPAGVGCGHSATESARIEAFALLQRYFSESIE